MNLQQFYQRFEVDYEVVQKAGFNPYYPVIESGLDDIIIVEGKKLIDLASNNYLGLANDIRLKNAGKQAIEKYGMSLCATPIASGYSDLYDKVRHKLSKFVGLESTLIYPSCYQANNGLFNVITSSEDIAIIDRCAHSSLIEGVRSTGCKIWPFHHNDMEHLEKGLKISQKYRQAFVITESVFSTEGTIAAFSEIVALCEKYGAMSVIDDSHGIGVIGKTGRGILEHAGIKDFNGIYTASLGKSLANSGGMISGNKKIIDYLKYYSSHLVYSTSIIPSSLAGIDTILDIIDEEFPERSKKMWHYTNLICDTLIESGYTVSNSSTAITSIKSGNSLETLQLAKKIFERGVLVTPFIYPSVQHNEGRIRIIAGANMKPSTFNKALKAFRDIND